MRTIEVDWVQEHTTIVEVWDDGTFEFATSSTPGPEIKNIIDPEGGLEIDREALLDFIQLEVI